MTLFFNSHRKRQARSKKATKKPRPKSSFQHRSDVVPTSNNMVPISNNIASHQSLSSSCGIECILPSPSPPPASQGSQQSFSVRDLLIEEGLSEYLASSSGGGLNTTSVKTILIRLSDFLVWTYAKMYNDQLLVPCAMKWMKNVIVFHFKLIGPYVCHLETVKHRSPGTILHLLNDIKKAVIWFLAFRNPVEMDDSDNLAIQRSDVEPLFHLIRTISRNMAKRMKRDRSSNEKNTLAGIVYQRELPVTGLKGLLETVHSQMDWIDSFMGKIKSEECIMVLDKDIYDQFMQTLYASIYVCAPQGRVGGIAELNCVQGLEMLKCGFTHSNSFKTNATYGYQPVIVADISCSLLWDYIHHLRPKISGTPTDSTPKAPLWIQFNGSKCSNTIISHKVTRFFVRTMQLHITTTNIRKLVEIEMENGKREGIITEHEREAVKKISGHGSSTVTDFYLKSDRTADAHHGRSAFEKIMHEHGARYSTNATCCEDWNFKDNLVHAPWGTDHPAFSKTTASNMRVQWSHAEIQYIVNWIKANTQLVAVNRVAKCLNSIKRDETAIPIFHVHHILTSARLRTGFDKAKQILEDEMEV